ncbi:hypothetical protein N7456_003855 [Penicillium angulare]|uniref:TPR-like protein n=1 Tax=Penicillium angulare TaxID=116970 RepID=A0A9W9FWA7_9EURO|nr:hypothetical protein N7456_003855 [Penicillium angulare]
MSDIKFGDQNSGFQLGVNTGQITLNQHHYPKPSEHPPSPFSTVPFPRDPDFIERGPLLDDIHEKISSPAARTALVGLGGAGKSQLAIEYSYRVREKSPKTWIFWIHASNVARFEEGFQRIADRVKIPGRQDPSQSVFRLVYNWLCDEKNGPWILILDNIDDGHYLKEPLAAKAGAQANDASVQSGVSGQTPWSFIPRVPHGGIFITTRSQLVAKQLVGENFIDVDVMDRSQALSLMETKLDTQSSRAGIEELCEALEYMPLAIVQAAAYIKQRAPRCSVLQYLDDIRKNDRKRTKLLAHEGEDLHRDDQAKNSILITWQISFEHIQRTRSSASDLLSLMSFFDRQGILEFVLRGVLAGDKAKSSKPLHGLSDSDEESDAESDGDYEFEEDIMILRDFSFISLTDDLHIFQMHGLVQLATRNWLELHGDVSQWRGKFIGSLSEHFATIERPYDLWQKRQLLFPHIKAALDHRPDTPDVLEKWATLMHEGATYAWGKSNFPDGDMMATKAMSTRKKLFGAQHKKTISSSSLLGSILILGGKYDKAESVLKEAIAICEASEPPKVILRDMLMHSLGDLYRQTFKYKESETILTKVLESISAGNSKMTGNLAACMGNLATTYSEQGRYLEAEELALRALELSRKELGEKDPATLLVVNALGHTYRCQSRFDEATALLEPTLKTALAMFGDVNFQTLVVQYNLAGVYSRQCRFEEAEALQLPAIQGFQKLLGDDHVRTLQAFSELAAIYFGQHQFEKAQPIMERVQEGWKRGYGEEHLMTANATLDLASLYSYLGKYQEAEKLMDSTQKILKEVLGEKHPVRLLNLSNLGAVYIDQEKLDDSEQLLNWVLEAQKEVVGEKNIYTFLTMHNLATCYQQQERWQEAESLQTKLLALQNEVLGEEHLDTLECMGKLAISFESLGRIDEAIDLMTESHDKQIQSLGAEDPNVQQCAEYLKSWKEKQEGKQT